MAKKKREPDPQLSEKANQVFAIMEDYEKMLGEWYLLKSLVIVLASDTATEEEKQEAKTQAKEFLALCEQLAM